jgi:glutamate dehydrogenase (NADP+)
MRFCRHLPASYTAILVLIPTSRQATSALGGREVAYMAGMVKKLGNRADCVFTGKGLSFGGSLMRPEATGFGTVYFAQDAEDAWFVTGGMRVSVSGSGNVANTPLPRPWNWVPRC